MHVFPKTPGRASVMLHTIRQGESDSEVIINFGTKFRLSVDLTVI